MASFLKKLIQKKNPASGVTEENHAEPSSSLAPVSPATNMSSTAGGSQAGNQLIPHSQQDRGNSASKASLVDPYGIFIFKNQLDSAPEVVDIVALHGLNGHYQQTWISPTTGAN
jgi:hypothetical protein